MKYNIHIECTYDDTEGYQKILCKCLNVKENDLDKITESVNILYNDFKNLEFLQEIYISIKTNIIILHECDDDICFTFLFGYDTFDIMHNILCEFYKTNNISDKLISNMKDKISKIV